MFFTEESRNSLAKCEEKLNQLLQYLLLIDASQKEMKKKIESLETRLDGYVTNTFNSHNRMSSEIQHILGEVDYLYKEHCYIKHQEPNLSKKKASTKKRRLIGEKPSLYSENTGK